MEPKKESMSSEVGMQPSASNVRTFNHKEGEGPMNTEKQINGEQELSVLVKAFAQSPLRKARYEFMKEYLQREGSYLFFKKSQEELSGWTREHIEQALEDVIRCGDGKVGRFLLDGSFIVVLRKKKEISKSETTREVYQSDNRQEGGL
jgi:hypothetical protein